MEKFIEKHQKVIDNVFCGIYTGFKTKKQEIIEMSYMIDRKKLVALFPNLFPYFCDFIEQEEATFRLKDILNSEKLKSMFAD